MAKLAIKKASTDVTTYVFIQDSSKTTGEGLAGLAYNTGSLVGYYVRPKGSATAITLATQTVTGDHSDGGFVEIDATNMPGVYRLDLPDAVCATGVPSVVVMLKGATDMSPVVLEIQLTDFDLNTAAITAAAVADAVLDEATSGHTSAGSFGKAVTDILADTGTDGVKIANTQPAITWGQQKIVADAEDEGALHIVNTNEGGVGQANIGGLAGLVNDGDTAVVNYGETYGMHSSGNTAGMYNSGKTAGMHNYSASTGGAGMKNEAQGTSSSGMSNEAWGSTSIGIRNIGTTRNVAGYDPDQATEATLTAMKGAGWTDETLAKIVTDIAAISAGSGATAQEVWEYATRVLTAGTNIDLSALATATDLATVDTVVDAIKAKTDNLPASPAAVGSAMTLTAAYDKAKDDVLTPLGVVDGIVDAIKVQTDKIPATPASAGEYTANIGAIKAKTDNLPLSPASSGEYTSALTAIQNDLDNPSQYKADVSGLATSAELAQTEADIIAAMPDETVIPDGIALEASVQAIKAKTDNLPATPASAGEYTTNIGAIKAKTDNLPASPASAGEYTSALTAIQNDLDNPDQYKADVSGLATTTDMSDLKDRIDAVDTIADAILEDTGTDGVVLKAAGLNADAVTKIQSGLALEATLTAIKGVGWNNGTLQNIKNDTESQQTTLQGIKGEDWTNETLAKIVSDIATISAGSGATAQEVWEYTTRVLTAGTNIDLSALATAADLATLDGKVDTVDGILDDLHDTDIPAIKAETALIVEDTGTTLDALIKDIPTNTELATALGTADDAVLAAVAAAKTVIDNIHDTDLPAVKTETAAIKAKTDNLPATPASAGEYTSALTAIQNDLDNPSQYKADVSGLATSAELSDVEDNIIAAMPDETVIPDGIALETSVQAIKAKTDNLPANTATALAAIQSDLDNPAQYKADVSGLATTAHVQEVEDKVDTADAVADAIKAKTDQLTFTAANKVDATTDTSSIAGDVWSYAKRTLTHPSVSAEEPEDSNTLILYRDADIAIELTDLTIPAGAKKYIFTIKDNLDGGDDQAVLQASYAIDGSEVETNTLVYINSAVPPALTNPVTFTLTETNITIDLTAEAAALLPRYERGYLNWDLKLVTDAAVTIVLQGLAQIIGTSTRAIE